jgi:hypothetical protein
MSESTIKTSADTANASDSTVVANTAERRRWESPVLTKLPAVEASVGSAGQMDADGYS